jgi:hypothetical protein
MPDPLDDKLDAIARQPFRAKFHLRGRDRVTAELRGPSTIRLHARELAGMERPRGDILTDPSDVQAMYDNIPVADKKLQWIEGTTARWDGYLEFQRRPQPMLDWIARYI